MAPTTTIAKQTQTPIWMPACGRATGGHREVQDDRADGERGRAAQQFEHGEHALQLSRAQRKAGGEQGGCHRRPDSEPDQPRADDHERVRTAGHAGEYGRAGGEREQADPRQRGHEARPYQSAEQQRGDDGAAELGEEQRAGVQRGVVALERGLREFDQRDRGGAGRDRDVIAATGNVCTSWRIGISGSRAVIWWTIRPISRATPDSSGAKAIRSSIRWV